MDKFLQKPGTSKSTTKGQNKRAGQQKRLFELQKVVKLNASKYTICQTELARLRETLENPTTSVQELGHCLRHLDSLILHSDALITSQVGPAVKRLRKHPDPSVGTLATKLTQKWRSIIVQEASKEC